MTDKQNKLIPKLRFPEFKNDGEWESYAIEDLFEVRNGYTPSKSNPEFWEGGTIPWFRMEDIRQNGHILSDSIQHITPQAVKGTGLFPAYSIIVATTATIGEHALLIADSLANQRFTFLTKRKSLDDKLDMMFFHQYMFIVDEWCKRNTNFGGLLSVNMSAFKKLRVPVPSIQEQKRIADFLTSLDNLLAGTKAKLEQLIDHKKGLMQKLFPAPGKTLPEYRFREFRESFDWSFRPGDELFRPIVNKSPDSILPILAITQDHGAIPRELIDYKVIVSDKSVAGYKVVDIGDFIISLRSFQGGIEYSRFKGLCSPAYIVFRKKTPNICDDFYRFYFKSDRFVLDLNRNIEGIRDGKIVSFQHFSEIAIPCPSFDEQMRIAQSLSSIDELINKYSAKLSFLMDFKKGLLQRVLI